MLYPRNHRRTLVALAWFALFVVGSSPPVAGQPDRIHSRAQEHVGSSERELRIYAPFLSREAFPCDETVGRFCLRYGFGKLGDRPTPRPELLTALNEAIRALEDLSKEVSHDTVVAGSLVRLLVEGGGTGRAVEAALQFAVSNTLDPWSYLLLGFALNGDGQIQASERAFQTALLHMEPGWPEGRRTSLLPHVPRQASVPTWGDDLEELTRRFGVPAPQRVMLCGSFPFAF